MSENSSVLQAQILLLLIDDFLNSADTMFQKTSIAFRKEVSSARLLPNKKVLDNNQAIAELRRRGIQTILGEYITLSQRYHERQKFKNYFNTDNHKITSMLEKLHDVLDATVQDSRLYENKSDKKERYNEGIKTSVVADDVLASLLLEKNENISNNVMNLNGMNQNNGNIHLSNSNIHIPNSNIHIPNSNTHLQSSNIHLQSSNTHLNGLQMSNNALANTFPLSSMKINMASPINFPSSSVRKPMSPVPNNSKTMKILDPLNRSNVPSNCNISVYKSSPNLSEHFKSPSRANDLHQIEIVQNQSKKRKKDTPKKIPTSDHDFQWTKPPTMVRLI
jgi:hypothetical protein